MAAPVEQSVSMRPEGASPLLDRVAGIR